jgi:hypothetical protein
MATMFALAICFQLLPLLLVVKSSCAALMKHRRLWPNVWMQETVLTNSKIFSTRSLRFDSEVWL